MRAVAENTVKRSSSAHVQDGYALEGVALTHPYRRLSAEFGVSKSELAEYYLEVAHEMMPSVAERPLTIVRCPRERVGRCFFQKHFDEEDLVGLRLVDIEEANGNVGRYAALAVSAGLVQLVQLGTLEIHHWSARRDDLEHPDRLICDLDPAPGIVWARLRDAAREVRERLQRHGIASFVRTTGGKGLHVVAPLERRHSWQQVREFAKGIAEAMAADAPDKFVAAAAKREREGRIYVDYMRNARGATAIANYSTRASRGLPVAVPLNWEELQRISGPDHYLLPSIRRRLKHLEAAPWPEFNDLQQRLPN